MADNQQWNPVAEAKKKYSGLQTWTDDSVLETMLDPSKFRSAFPEYAHLNDETIKHNVSSLLAKTPNYLSTQSTGKPPEGTYAMQGPNTQVINVPYSKVPVALQSKEWGWTASNDPSSDNSSGTQYYKDKTAEGSRPTFWSGLSERAQKMLQPVPNEPNLNPVSNIDRAAGRVLYSTPGFLKDLAYAYMNSGKDQSRSFTDMIDPGQVPENLKKQFQSDVRVDPKMAWENLTGSLIGMGLVAAATHAAPKAIRAGVEPIKNKVAETIRPFIREQLEVPRNIERVTEQYKKASQGVKTANENATQRHHGQSFDAAQETRGAEIGNEYNVNQEKESLKNQRNQKVREVLEQNRRVLDKHQKHAGEITQANDEIDKAVQQRQEDEAKLEQDTTAYYTKEDTIASKVKADANAKWTPVHENLDAETIDGDEIEKPLSKIIELSPEVRREIHQLVPDAEDVEPDSPYGKERKVVLEALGHTVDDYFTKMDDFSRANVDRAVAARGLTPDPIDFDPKAGVGVAFDKIHRAQSIIGRNIRNGRYGYEGPLLGEMKQLQKILYDAESKIAAAHGKTAELNAARQATREYHEAFGRARNTPKDQSDLRKQQANPEKFKEDNEQERVDTAKKHDPTLAEDHEKVKALRDRLKKEPTIEALTNKKKVVPAPPTVGDLREGFRLGELPEPLDIEAEAKNKVGEPVRNLGPDRPSELPPPDAGEYVRKNLTYLSDALRSYGRVGPWVLRLVAVSALRSLFKPFETKESSASSAFGGSLSGGQAILTLLTKALRGQGALEWLAKPTKEDLEVIDKLPPDDAARLRKAFSALAQEEIRQHPEKAKIPVIPWKAEWLATGTLSRETKDVKQLKKEAKKRDPSKPALPAGVTHYFDESSGSIIPVQ